MAECDNQRKVRRPAALTLSFLLTFGLVVFLTAGQTMAVLVFPLLLALCVVGSLRVLGITISLERKNLEVYALLILPLIIDAGLLFFLRPLRQEPIVWFAVVMSFPLFYLLFISLSALQCYRMLPNHVARVILNVLTLGAGYLCYAFVFEMSWPLLLGLLATFALCELLFLQGLFWWSNANLRYSFFYSTLASFLLATLFFTLYYWPLGYLVTGFVMTLGQYILMGLIQHYFKKTLTGRIVLEHVIVASFSLVAILSQASWWPNL